MFDYILEKKRKKKKWQKSFNMKKYVLTIIIKLEEPSKHKKRLTNTPYIACTGSFCQQLQQVKTEFGRAPSLYPLPLELPPLRHPIDQVQTICRRTGMLGQTTGSVRARDLSWSVPLDSKHREYEIWWRGKKTSVLKQSWLYARYYSVVDVT